MGNRKLLKARLIKSRLQIGPDGLIHCEVWEYEVATGRTPHDCSGGWEMNEVLYPRNDFPIAIQKYLWNEINCAIVCGWVHPRVGHTTGFREWYQLRQVERYGAEAVKDYLLNGPNKVKTRPLF